MCLRPTVSSAPGHRPFTPMADVPIDSMLPHPLSRVRDYCAGRRSEVRCRKRERKVASLPESRLLELIERVFGLWGGLGTVAVSLVILLVLILLLTQQVALLVRVVLASMLFSLLAEPFHTMFDFLRWTLVILIVPIGFLSIQEAGRSWKLLAIYGLLGAVFTFRAPDIMWSLQSSVLLLSTIFGLGLCCYRIFDTEDRVLQICKFLAVLAAIFALVNGIAFAIGFTPGNRFAGATIRVGQLAIAGALLLPFLFWRATIAQSSLAAVPWLVLAGLSSTEIILTTQRTGMLLAFVSCGYFLLPLIRRHFSRASLAIIVSGFLLGVGLLLAGPEHREFLLTRLIGKGDSGDFLGNRGALWRLGFNLCMESPILGSGIGSDAIAALDYGNVTFHNAYLGIWYNSGIFGLLALVAAMIFAIGRARRVIQSELHPATQMAARAMAAMLLGIMPAVFFERSLAGASNLMVGLLLLAVACIDCLYRLTVEARVYDDAGTESEHWGYSSSQTI